MRVIVAGSRHLRISLDDVTKAVNESGFKVTEIVSGDCPTGADHAAILWAEYCLYPCRRFPADWEKHGKAAGPIRNAEMARNADALILIWDGKSRGSQNILTAAVANKLPIHQVVI